MVYFFADCHHALDLEELARNANRHPKEFRCNAFKLIRPASSNLPPDSVVLVWWMLAQVGEVEMTYIAKAVTSPKWKWTIVGGTDT